MKPPISFNILLILVMKNSTSVIYLLVFSLLQFYPLQKGYSQEITSTADFFEQANNFFKEHVKEQSITYLEIKADPTLLTNLIEFIETTKLENFSGDEQKAYLINTYNLLIINAVLMHFPALSTQDIDGFFNKESHLVAGQQITLDRLEKELILKVHPDPRLHFVLVCAAKGCPPIANFAYQPTLLETQLTQQTKKALNSSNFLFVEKVSNTAYLSPIFQWYKNDFAPDARSYINKYKSTALPDNCLIKHYEYDWKLNAWDLEIIEDLIQTRY